MSKLDDNSGMSPEQSQLSPREAASLLGVSIATLRRWSESGRIVAERTAGGHRRFSTAEVQRVLANGRAPGQAFALRPPLRPLPELARMTSEKRKELFGRVERSLYSDGPQGWFATARGQRHGESLLEAIGEAAAGGDYEIALEAARELAGAAFSSGVGIVECDSMLELLAATVTRSLFGGDRAEVGPARRLFVSVRQTLLEAYARAWRSQTPEGRSESSPSGLQMLVEELAQLHEVRAAIALSPEPDGLGLRPAAAAAAPGEELPSVPSRVAPGEGPIGRVAAERRARLVRWPSNGAGSAAARPSSLPLRCVAGTA